jgi:hypothetical protein
VRLNFRLDVLNFGQRASHLVWSLCIFAAMQHGAWGANDNASPLTVSVISVTSEVIKNYDNPEVCRQTILTAQQIAQREEDEKTWWEKNWVASLAGGAGLVGGVPLSAHVASIASGALVVPTILLTGGVAFFVTQLLIPANPMLSPPKPGSYIASQKFYVEPVCQPEPIKYQALSHYRVSYQFNGKTQTALLKYDPGARLAINAQGRPLNEIFRAAAAKP